MCITWDLRFSAYLPVCARAGVIVIPIGVLVDHFMYAILDGNFTAVDFLSNECPTTHTIFNIVHLFPISFNTRREKNICIHSKPLCIVTAATSTLLLITRIVPEVKEEGMAREWFSGFQTSEGARAYFQRGGALTVKGSNLSSPPRPRSQSPRVVHLEPHQPRRPHRCDGGRGREVGCLTRARRQ